MKPNRVTISDFLSIFYSKPLRDHKKYIRISKYDSSFREGYKPQVIRDFLKFLQLLLKILQHTLSKLKNRKLYVGKVTRIYLLRSIEYGFGYNRVDF